MSVVIVGGHDKMTKDYIRVCKKYNCIYIKILHLTPRKN